MRIWSLFSAAIAACLALASWGSHAVAAPHFKAVAFDYFVIFNPNSVVPKIEKVFPGKGPELTKAWRAKQFEYGASCARSPGGTRTSSR